MSLGEFPLSYCTNVHPGRTVREVENGLDRYAVPVMRASGRPLAAGLWLARSVVTELLQSPATLQQFTEGLGRRGLSCHTLNAFPFGDFHSERVKENVYLPDWSTPQRLTYTIDCAEVLARLLGTGVDDGSISTMPLGFRGFEHSPEFLQRCAGGLIECARRLADLRHRTGKQIRIAVEPEPFCVVETTSQTVDFFKLLWREAERAGAIDAVRTHIGLCFDVCHQAVEFEEVGESIRQLDREGVRINKLHVSCALQLDDPRNNAKGRAALKRYVEPRYLHQTIASLPDERYARAVDLTEQLIDSPGDDFLSAESWRVHFHVPVDADRIGPLRTTRPALRDALVAVARLSYAPHIEVETYTWGVLPGEDRPDLIAGLTRELAATRALLADVAGIDKMPGSI
jgi:sugar phosphate isomerase/epimerase